MSQTMTRRIPTVRPHLADLPGYAPVVPPELRASQAGLDPADCLKLDANENPYGMLSNVREALEQAVRDPSFGAIYPDPNQTELRNALARYLHFYGPESIIAGAGADELLDLIFRALLPPDGVVITCPPSFGMYPFLADVNQLQLVEVPRLSRFRISRAKLLKAAQAAPPGSLVVLTSPNNPSGDLIPSSLLLQLLKQDVTVIIDEAYYEFAADYRSPIMLLPEFGNLIVVRTLSKWAGIAGLRLGYALADPELIAELMKLKQPYNINEAALVAGLAALSPDSRAASHAQFSKIRRTRRHLVRTLESFEGLSPLKSHANFILVEVNASIGSGREFHDRLASVGVFVRAYDDPRLANHVRISIPHHDQLDTLIERIRSVL